MTREFTATPEALARAKEAGVYGNVQKRLQRMAARSAPFTHPAGNRRFQSFVLRIAGDQIIDVSRLDDQG